VRRLWYYYIYLLVVWGGFRFWGRLSEVVEELWFKPLLWLVPLFWWNLALKEQLVMFGRKWGSSIGWGVGVGVFYYLLIRGWSLQGDWGSNVLLIAAATAVTEEITFSGFVAGYLERRRRGWVGNFLIVGLMVAIIRLPVWLAVYKLGLSEVTGAWFLAGASGAINAWIRVKTGNVTGSILARMGMNLAVLG
jgi:hypothetical protein